MLKITRTHLAIIFVSYRRNLDHTAASSSDKELGGDGNDTQCVVIAPSCFAQLIPETTSLFLSIIFL